MSHAVRFRDVTGAVQLEDAASLEEALERVERLRNGDDATEVRVFREIPIEVRTYYKVVAVDEHAVADQAPADPPADESEGQLIAEAASAPPSSPPPGVPVEPPSGAMVMSRPVATPAAESSVRAAESAADAPEPEHRRALFSRS